jgi:hypothetical protein
MARETAEFRRSHTNTDTNTDTLSVGLLRTSYQHVVEADKYTTKNEPKTGIFMRLLRFKHAIPRTIPMKNYNVKRSATEIGFAT